MDQGEQAAQGGTQSCTPPGWGGVWCPQARKVLALPRVLWEEWVMSGRGSLSKTSTHREENRMPNTAAASPRLPSSSRKLTGLQAKEGMSLTPDHGHLVPTILCPRAALSHAAPQHPSTRLAAG